MILQASALFFLFLLPILFLFSISRKKSSSPSTKLPKSYPIIGSFFATKANTHRRHQWFTEIIQSSPSATAVLERIFVPRIILTGNPEVVQHILKTNFSVYQKGNAFKIPLSDFLGGGIFNVDGESWKLQRQVASYEFNTKSLRKFVETVVDTELSDRLIPMLSAAAAADNSVLDLQDILQRFAFDNICKIAFGYDPSYLLPSLPDAKFAVAFDEAVKISSERSSSLIPIVWKIKKLLGIGSEKKLAGAISEVRDFAKMIVTEKKKELDEKSSLQSFDLLSRFLSSGHSDEIFVTDIVISFILAGRDTTSAALTWFFWLISNNPRVEKEILEEINGKTSEGSIYEEVKEMVYTHAAICESMRLYPPVPGDSKEAVSDDVLPEGTVVKKGDKVLYHPYAMGRLEDLWGKDWEEFRPERWLKEEEESKKRVFVARDAYTYPVFQAGPRICLGKEMAFLQMKRVVAGVMKNFRVVPAMGDGVEPVFISFLTSKMKDGFPVRFEKRAQN